MTRQRPVTLLEVLIVLLLVAIIGSAIGINIRGAVQRQRFLTETQVIVDRLRLAQDMMLILGNDVRLVFGEAEDREGISFWLEAEGKIPPVWEQIIAESTKTLEAIHSVNFNDALPHPTEQGKLEILFYSGGSVMSEGLMLVSTHENPLETDAYNRIICLNGYPGPIRAEAPKNNLFTCREQGPPFSPEELTRETVLEITRYEEEKKQLAPQAAP